MANEVSDGKAEVERVAKACEVFARQWREGHPPGHDAVMELHRALKKSTPELDREALDYFADLERWKAEQLAVEATWDPQAVARVLEMPLACEIRSEILPRVQAMKERLASLDWHPITPEDQPKPFIHEVWGLHVGIKIVENWMPTVFESPGHGWIKAGYTHMRLLNIPMPKKDEGR